MGRFRYVKNWKIRTDIESYNVDYPFFEFLNLKIRRAFKMRLANWGFAVRGAAFYYYFLKTKKTRSYILSFVNKAKFNNPLKNISTTFKYDLSLPEYFVKSKDLIFYKQDSEFEYLEDEFRMQIFLLYDAKFIDYRDWMFSFYPFIEGCDINNECLFFNIFFVKSSLLMLACTF